MSLMRATITFPLLLVLTACTQTAATGPAARVALPEPSPRPSGPGCGPQIAHFKEVLAYDLSVRRLAQSVYDKTTGPLDQADAACAAGRSGEGMAILRRTKTASGYP